MCICRDDNVMYLKVIHVCSFFFENLVVFISSLSFCLCLSSCSNRERELFIRENIVKTMPSIIINL